MKKALIFILVLFSALVLVESTGSYYSDSVVISDNVFVAGEWNGGDLSFEKYQLTSDSSQQGNPLIYGDLAVWSDWRNDFDMGIDIWSYDFESKEMSSLIVKPDVQSPAELTDQYLIYHDYNESHQNDIWLYDLETLEDKLILGGSGHQTVVGIYKDNLYYIEGYNKGDLYQYDLETGNSKYLFWLSNSHLAVNRDFLVWRGTSYNLVGYDLEEQKEFDISELNKGHQYGPSVYKKKLVWTGDNSSPGVFFKDLVSGEEKKISDEGGRADIWGRYVTWVQDDGVGVHNVYVHDLISSQTIQLSDDGPQQPSPTVPSIYENIIGWKSWQTGNGDIYIAELSL